MYFHSYFDILFSINIDNSDFYPRYLFIMKEIIDQFLWTRDNKVITRDKHRVPGLANISHWNFRAATAPAQVHYHNNIYEFHCMIRGRRIFQIMSDDGTFKSFSVSGNELAVTFPGQVHGYQDNYVEPYEFYSFQLDVSDPDHMLGLDTFYSRMLCEELSQMQDRMHASGEQRLKVGYTHINLLRSAFNFFSSFQEDTTMMGVQFLSCFCYSLKYLTPVTKNPVIDPNIQSSIDYMNAHFQDNPPLQAAADAAGYSLSYFKAKFKEETGNTPADYLATTRVEYAKNRLTESEDSITEIASDLNYSSVSHFCYAFKKRTSYTPMSYRQRYQRLKPRSTST